MSGQIGSEPTWQEYIGNLLDCTREWIRVLKPSGNLFVDLGDKYSGAQAQNDGRSPSDSAEFWRRTDPKRTGIPAKSLMDLPHRYAIACVDELGLIKRADIVWSKPNGLPESVQDRVRRSHEVVFHFTRLPRYFSAVDEIREAHAYPAGRRFERNTPRGNGTPAASYVINSPLNPLGKLPGSVWDIPSQPLTVPPHLGVDHFAAFPMELPRRLVLGWSPPGVCTGCGEGRRPIASAEYEPTPRTNNAGAIERNGDNHFTQSERPHGRARSLVSVTGYACACPQPTAPTRPAIVLDPFGGTGTTALIAHAYGRHGITIDHSADYCRLAQWRTTDPAERAKALEVPKPPPVPQGQDSLFDLTEMTP